MPEKYDNFLNASVQGLIYDCDDPEKLAKFYAKLLGGTLYQDPYCGYCVKTPVLPFEIGFQLDEDYTRPVWPGQKGDQLQMMHIDIKVNNRESAIEYALSIGAGMPKEQFCQPDWDVQWVTLLDPAGHPFCLFEE
ncbi:MAG: VOC family protein [Sporomusa sp.]